MLAGRADRRPRPRRALISLGAGNLPGLALAAVQILPLGFYLAKSPVWSDRAKRATGVVANRSAAAARRGLHGGSLRLRQPAPRPSQSGPGPGRAQPERVGGGICRSGDPALAGAAGRGRRAAANRVSRFWPGSWSFGAMGAFRCRRWTTCCAALPVLDVTDNRRLTLWVAFGSDAAGRDRASTSSAQSRRLAARLARLWIVAAVGSGSLGRAHPGRSKRQLRERAVAPLPPGRTRGAGRGSD